MIFITGATGFIGETLLKILLPKHKVTCLVLEKEKLLLQHKHLEIIQGSITDLNLLEKVTKKVTAIIHLAAITNAAHKHIYEVNVKGTRNLVEVAKRNKIKQFIFISTENIQYQGKDNYTKTKQQAEILVRRLKYHTILREPIVYGKGDTKYIGKLLQLIKKYPVVPIPGKGQYLVQPIYVEDLALCIKKALNKNIRGTHTLVGKRALSYERIVDTLIKELHLRRIKIHIPLFLLKLATRIMPLVGMKPPLTTTQLTNLAINREHDITHMKKYFGYTPLSFEEGIRKTIKQEHL